MELTWLQIAILSVVQGFCETLPLSGSGYVRIARQLLGLPIDGSADGLCTVLGRIAVMLAACLVFRRDIAACFRRPSRERPRSKPQEAERLGRRMLVLVFVGLVPTALGLVFRGKLAAAGGSLLQLAGLLLLNGLIIFLCDRIGHGSRELRTATVADGLFIGAAQAVSGIPGLSRTGLTMTMGILRGLDLEFSLRYSFLLGIPAMLFSALLQLLDAGRASALSFRPVYLLGFVLAGVTAYLALRLLRFVVRRNAVGSFAYAVWGAGLFAFILYLVC